MDFFSANFYHLFEPFMYLTHKKLMRCTKIDSKSTTINAIGSMLGKMVGDIFGVIRV